MKLSYQNLLIQTLSKIQKGKLILELPDHTEQFFGQANHRNPIVVKIIDPAFFRRVVLQNDIGLGESYILNQWKCDDIAGFLKLLIRNQPYFGNERNKIWVKLLRNTLTAIDRIKHRLNSNTTRQSQINIQAHYDLGNKFYSQFLDESMTYSSAYFSKKNQTLKEAQFEKYDRICRKLSLRKKHHILEIGSGWGGFAIHAAKNYGCQVTTITISKEQYDFAKSTIKEHGLQKQIKILFKDYRQMKGQYDRIVSIEMLEAVGHEHLKSYFQQCKLLLKPNGLISLQVILSPDSRYSGYRKDVDYIKKHIFPGGHLPSVDSIQKQIRSNSDWDLLHYESFGKHYAETLRRWNTSFVQATGQRHALGFDNHFDRKWEFYFKYCEAGFDTRHIQVGQFVFGSPNNEQFEFENDDMIKNSQRSREAVIRW